MASVTTRTPDDSDLARVAPETTALPLPSAPATVRIEPPRGWLELRLDEEWQYREQPEKLVKATASYDCVIASSY